MVSFDTSIIPDDAVITNATLSLTFLNKTTQLGGNNEIALVSGSPAHPANYTATDYSWYNMTELAPRFDYSSVSGGNITFSLNGDGLNAIDETGISSFGVLSVDDVDGAFSGTWSSGKMNYLAVYGNSSAYPPVLTVTYSKPVSIAATCPINLETMYNVTGDGTDESGKLQAAFDYAAAHPGCKVVFPAGKTIVVGNRMTTGGYTEIDGAGSTIFIKAGYANSSSIIRFGDYNYIHDLKLDGNRYGISQSAIPLVYGFRLGNWNVFEDNEIFNTSAYSLYVETASNWVIRNNFIHDGIQYGIATGPGGNSAVYSNNGTVTQNTIWNMSQVGIKIRGTGNSTISENTIIIPDSDGFSASGIQLYSDDTGNKNVVIRSNIISDDYTNATRSGGGYAVGIKSDSLNENPGCIIESNIINSTYYGIQSQSDGIVVTGNRVSNVRRAGISVEANDGQYLNNILKNSGIVLDGQDKTIKNNIFKYNSINGGNGDSLRLATGDGIAFFYNATNNTFDFNSLNVDRYGFNVNNTYGTVSKTRIQNNTITAGKACYLDQGSATVIAMNTCNGVFTK